MPKSRAPDRVALTGADCFLRAFDFEVRRKSGASHLSQLVLRLGPGFDPGALAKLIAEVAAAQPMLHSISPGGRRRRGSRSTTRRAWRAIRRFRRSSPSA